MNIEKHKKNIFLQANITVFSISTTRSLLNDKSGQWIKEEIKKNGHIINSYKILKDNKIEIRNEVEKNIMGKNIDAIILTGGTGITKQDITIEAVSPLFIKKITHFGSLFVQLSYDEIGSAAFLSRACAGIINETVVFCIPGSIKACILACNKLIFPEISHLISHIREA